MAFGPVNVGQAEVQNTGELNSSMVGIPGGLATLGGDGRLTESQRPLLDVPTTAQAEALAASAVSGHNSSASAHSDLRAAINALEASVQAVNLKFGTSVTQNPFTVGFADLNSVTVTGVWNAAQSRVEF